MADPGQTGRIRLHTFGAPRLETADGPCVGPAAQRHRLALLSVLAAAPGRQASRDRLLALLWPEREADQGRTLLNSAIHALRRELGAESLRSVGDALYLDAVWVATDLDSFEQHVLEGNPARAVAQYTGPFLDGFHLPDSEPFEEWLATKRAHYHARVHELLWELADGATTAAVALGWTERLVHHDHLSARAAVRHMQALRDAGDVSAALAFASAFQQRLASELGARPDPAVRALEVELLQTEAPTRPAFQHVETLAPVLGEPVALASSSEPASPRPPKRRSVKVVATIAVLGLVALLARAAAARGGEGSPNTVLVMPFEVRGSSDLAYLATGVMDVLAARLHGMGDLVTVDPNAVLDRLAERADGRAPSDVAWRLADEFGAGRVILGSLVEVGDRIELRAALHDPSGHRATDVLVGGARAELPALINDLTRRLLAEQLRSEGRQVASLAALTTDSLAALQALLEGEQAMRAGHVRVAADHFERAVTIDTLFALGFYRLGEARKRLPEQRVPWWEHSVHHTAARLADRLPAFERELVQTATQPSGATVPALRELAGRRPTSAEAWYRLGVALDYEASARGLPNAEAIASLTHARSLDRGHLLAASALAFAEARAGAWEDLNALEAELAEVSGADALLARTYLAFGRGDTAARRAVLNELGAAQESVVLEAATAVTTLTRDPESAVMLYSRLTETQRPVAIRAQAYLRLADLAMAAGRWRDAMHEIERAERLTGGPYLGKRARLAFLPHSPVTDVEAAGLHREMMVWLRRKQSPEGVGQSVPGLAYNAGMLSARRGDSAGVRDAIEILESLQGSEDARRTQQLIPSLRAEIAWLAGDVTRVIEQLEAVPDPNSNQRYLMARALEASGRVDDALRWYRSYPDLDPNAPGQLAWRAASLLRMADLHARRGERDQARALREEFLRLWRRADPSAAPMLADVRAIVASAR